MSKYLENEFVIFDTEYTAWKGSQARNFSGENEHREIIQIGAIKVKLVDNKYTVIDKINDVGYIYVKPKINTILSDYIINLTGISNKNISEEGYTFEDALNIFIKFCGNSKVYSYGNDWNSVVEENIELYEKKFPKTYNYDFIRDFGEKCHNIIPYFKKYGIDTSKYTSGTIYKSVNIEVNIDNNHFAIFDCLSIFMTINKLFILNSLQ